MFRILTKRVYVGMYVQLHCAEGVVSVAVSDVTGRLLLRNNSRQRQRSQKHARRWTVGGGLWTVDDAR